MQVPGQVTCTRRSELQANWLWTTVLGLVVVVSLWFGFDSWREGAPVDNWGLGVFTLFTLGWVAFALRTVRRQMEWFELGEASVILRPTKPVLGQALICNVQFERRPEGDTAAAAELRCTRITHTGYGKKYRTHIEELWHESKTLPSAAMMYFEFDPPDYLPDDSGLASSGTVWWLTVRGTGSARFNRRFRIPMQVAPAGKVASRSKPNLAYRAREQADRAAVGRKRDVGHWIGLVTGLIFSGVVVAGLVWLVQREPEMTFTEDGLDDGAENFKVRTKNLSGELRLGDLRHTNFTHLNVELRGRYRWDGRSLEIEADDIRMVARNCAPDCPAVRQLWLMLTGWHDEGGGSRAGDALAQSEPEEIGRAVHQNEVVSLGPRHWTLAMDRHADPRTASLMLHVSVDGNEFEYGLSFGGPEWRGLSREPGDALACAKLRGPTAAVDHFCTPRLAELLPSFRSAATRQRLLLQAVRRGNVEAVDLLLASGVAVDVRVERGYTPLMEAASGDYPDVMKRLLAVGADVDFREKTESEYGSPTPLGVALLGGSLDGVQQLVDNGASLQLEHFKSPPVHVAVEMDVPGALALMQAKGADLDVRAPWGNQPTALMAAAGTGKLDRVRELLALGADPAAADSAGNTARDYAATHGHAVVLALLASFPGICPMSGCTE